MSRLREKQTAVWTARLIAVAAIVALIPLWCTGVARAADKVILGGGAGIIVFPDTLCTLTGIGTDNRGNLVGFTSAHCGGPGAQVGAEAAQDAGVLGTMVAGNDSLDYAVIQFDPAKVTPVNNFNNFLITGIGPDPTTGQVACKLGTFVNQVCGRPGDSGAPVTVDTKLVGMIHGAFSEELPSCIVKYIPLHTPAVNESINAILGDINAKNRPGAGFVPIGA
jgi:hypothetical protein